MRNYGDITKISGYEVPPAEVIIGGSPCQNLSVAGNRKGLQGEESKLFLEQIRVIKEMREKCKNDGRADKINPRFMVWENVCFHGDTLITCEDGYKKIKDVHIGDKVKTHIGRFMPVMKVYKNPKQQLLKLKVSGSEDILVTPNHPFMTIKKVYSGKKVIDVTSPEWTPAKKLTDKHLIGYRTDKPTLPDNFINEDEAWAIGRWLADGSVDLTKSNPRMFFSIGVGKEEEARNHLSKLPYNIHENKPHSTVTNFCFTSYEFYTLISEAGIGAGNKRIPPYVFQLPFMRQKSVLEGYLSGDGYIRKRDNEIELSAVTASRELSYGIARLIRNVYGVSTNISVKEPKSGMIDGREIRANYPCYSVNASITNKVSHSVVEGSIIWQPVKSIEIIEKKETVYNLSVLEDNTYAANDIIVHNCGAFSSNKGEDFRRVLEETAKIADETAVIPRPPKGKWRNAGVIMGDGFSLAWRVLDAQFWGVPQRRRRIALVADFGGHSAPEILFERDGLCGDSAESGETREEITGNARKGIDSADEHVKAYGICSLSSNSMKSDNPYSGFFETNVSKTLDGNGGNPTCNQGGIVICYDVAHRADVVREYADSTPTLSHRMGTGGNNVPLVCGLNCMHDQQAVLVPVDCQKDTETTAIVRRLTPLECERLQGYPDGWCDIGDWTDSKGKSRKTTDTARYKALGNSIALPPWKWVLGRLIQHCEDKTMASLFDGIGGFPMIWQELGGTTVWTSEIEEFCCAVTGKRFG